MAPNLDLLTVDKKYQRTVDLFFNVLKINHEDVIKDILTNLSPIEFKLALGKTYYQEINHKFFNHQNIFNCNYLDIESGDYERFYHICHLYGEDKPIKVLTEALSDEIFVPTFIKGKNSVYYLLAGNLEICAKKVLGIAPVIKIVPVDFDLKVS